MDSNQHCSIVAHSETNTTTMDSISRRSTVAHPETNTATIDSISRRSTVAHPETNTATIDSISRRSTVAHPETNTATIDSNQHRSTVAHPEKNNAIMDPYPRRSTVAHAGTNTATIDSNQHRSTVAHKETNTATIDSNQHRSTVAQPVKNTAIMNPYPRTSTVAHPETNTAIMDPYPRRSTFAHPETNTATMDLNQRRSTAAGLGTNTVTTTAGTFVDGQRLFLLELMLLSFTASASAAASSSCPKGWLIMGSKCFLLKNAKVAKAEAEEMCTMEGGALATVRKPQESWFVWSYLDRAACRDEHPDPSQCHEWAASGKCGGSNQGWMDVQCQASCKRCGVGCVDKASDELCQFWESRGQCQAVGGWMRENCAWTCGCEPEDMDGFWANQALAVFKYVKNYPKLTKWKYSNCTRMDPVTGNWMLVPCDRLASGYVCEAGAATRSSSPSRQTALNEAGCPLTGDVVRSDYFWGFGDTCLGLVFMTDTWFAANATCYRFPSSSSFSTKDSRLVVVGDNRTNALLASKLPRNVSFWIGLSSRSDSRYFWADGRPLGDHFQAWADTPHVGLASSCVAMDPSGTIETWRDKNCKLRLNRLCQVARRRPEPPELLCPWGWTPFRNSCHRFFDEEVRCHRARRICESYGGHLPVIHDRPGVTFFMRLSRANAGSVTWLGLRFRPIEDDFLWADGTSFQWDTFSGTGTCKFCPWGPLQPDGDGNCISMRQGGAWYDDNPQSTFRYICSIRNVQCSYKGWAWHRGYCYLVLSRSPDGGSSSRSGRSGSSGRSSGGGGGEGHAYTWHRARRICNLYAAELASVWTREEMEFLRARMESGLKYWVGLDSEAVKAKAWVDGSVLSTATINIGGDGKADADADAPSRRDGDGCYYADLRSEALSRASCSRDAFGFICKKIEVAEYDRPSVPLPSNEKDKGGTTTIATDKSHVLEAAIFTPEPSLVGMAGVRDGLWQVNRRFLEAFVFFFILVFVLALIGVVLLHANKKPRSRYYANK